MSASGSHGVCEKPSAGSVCYGARTRINGLVFEHEQATGDPPTWKSDSKANRREPRFWRKQTACEEQEGTQTLTCVPRFATQEDGGDAYQESAPG